MGKRSQFQRLLSPNSDSSLDFSARKTSLSPKWGGESSGYAAKEEFTLFCCILEVPLGDT